MTGGVRKRGSSWSYYFDLGIVGGKRKKKEKGGFRTKKEAETALTKAMSEYNNAGQVFEPSEITVSDYFDEWFELHCKMNLKYYTQRAYLNVIENHIKPEFGSYKLKTLTPALLQGFANKLKIKGYSKSHMTSILTIFQSALDYAIEPMQYISQNPMKPVKFPKSERKPRERIILKLDEWQRIIDRFKDTRHYIPLMIGFYTGLRISETFGLTWDDIDLENKTLTVNKQLINFNADTDYSKKSTDKGKKLHRGIWGFGTPKTQTSCRTVSFGDTLHRALKAEKAKQLKNEMLHGESYTVQVLQDRQNRDDYKVQSIISVSKESGNQLPRVKMVCVNQKGCLTTPDTFKGCAKIIRDELHIAFDFHSLRHTHATMLIEAGANVKNVQARLGHTDISITLQTYVHDTQKMAEQSVELFEQATQTN